jgi:hypothetical protein
MNKNLNNFVEEFMVGYNCEGRAMYVQQQLQFDMRSWDMKSWEWNDECEMISN